MDIFGGMQKNYAMEQASQGPMAPGRPRTIAETIADQVAYHERKLADLKAAQEVLKNSEVLAALEALQKLSW